MKNTWNEAERGPQVGNAKEGHTIWKFILDEGHLTTELPVYSRVLRMGWFEGEQCVWVLVDLDEENMSPYEFEAHPLPFLENFSMYLLNGEKPFSVDHHGGFTYLYTWRVDDGDDLCEEHFQFFATKTGAPVPEEVANNGWVYLGHYGPFIQQELGLYVWYVRSKLWK